jgi:hypothetical protein
VVVSHLHSNKQRLVAHVLLYGMAPDDFVAGD